MKLSMLPRQLLASLFAGVSGSWKRQPRSKQMECLRCKPPLMVLREDPS